MHTYFVSYYVKFGTHTGYRNTPVDLPNPITSMKDIEVVTKKINKETIIPADRLTVLNYQLLSSD